MFFVSFFFQKPFPCHSLSQGQRRLVFIFYNSRAAPLKNGIESSLPLKQSSSFLLEPSSRGSHKYKSRTKQGECRDIINYSIGDENNRVETKTKKKKRSNAMGQSRWAGSIFFVDCTVGYKYFSSAWPAEMATFTDARYN